jgi:hypothetical protein
MKGTIKSIRLGEGGDDQADQPWRGTHLECADSKPSSNHLWKPATRLGF